MYVHCETPSTFSKGFMPLPDIDLWLIITTFGLLASEVVETIDCLFPSRIIVCL